ncbi:hypothetical protein Tco_1019574 [Tanacetum coccineum]|uniref:Uncharacterized protein n=1 Tax=Tanacetum coccineum TaxID=301880 RepID=A0ABQ5FXR0_9ASTR
MLATAKEKTVNGEVHIQALVDGKKVIVIEMSVRRALQLKDTEDLQAAEIVKLKDRVMKLERGISQDSRASKIRRVGRIYTSCFSKDLDVWVLRRIHPKGEENCSDLDGCMQRVTLVDEAQERNDDNLMFNTRVFDEQEVKVEKVVSTAEVTTVNATTTTVDKLTLAQTLIEIKGS